MANPPLVPPHSLQKNENDSSNNSDAPLSAEEANHHDAEVLEDQNKSIIWAIIKQIKIGSEVKHLQLPTFVLQPRSLLEKLTDSFVHPELLLNIPNISDPEQRFISVVRFYMSCWHTRPKGVRNPLNPVIGEFFQCRWNVADAKSYHTTTSNYFAEQLSHHPPHSAFCYWNIEKGVAVNGNLAPTYAKFMGNSAETKLQGMIKIHLSNKKDVDEEYELTFPGACVRGILFGTLLLEIVGKVYIQCKKTGYRADIDFKSKGMFRGKYNQISGSIQSKGKDLYTLAGFWDSVVTITNCKTKETTELFDASKHKEHEKLVPPEEEQQPNESRRYWLKVVKNMLAGNEDEALEEKRKLEAVQRASEKERKDANIKWIPKYFKEDSSGYFYYEKWNEILSQIRPSNGSTSSNSTKQ